MWQPMYCAFVLKVNNLCQIRSKYLILRKPKLYFLDLVIFQIRSYYKQIKKLDIRPKYDHELNLIRNDHS